MKTSLTTSKIKIAVGLLCFFSLAMLVTSASAGVVISELMYHPPQLLDDQYEFLELYNTGTSAVDLQSWVIDGIGFTFPAGASIGPNAYLVLAKDPISVQAAYGFLPSYAYTGKISNSGESIKLLDATGVVVDEVSYSTEPPWPVTPDELGPSLERIDPTLNGNTPRNWRASIAAAGHTGGALNSVNAVGLPPWIENVQHSTAQQGTPITVTASVVDATTVNLKYIINFGIPVIIAMKDNGLSGDGAAGDGVYGATILAQPLNTLIRYRIDATGATGTMGFPRSDDSVNYTGVYLEDTSVVTGLPVFHWFMDPVDYNDALAHYLTDACEPALLYYNGTLYDNVQVRVRGQSSRAYVKKNWKFYPPRNHDFFVPGLTGLPVDNFNLQASFADKSYMREYLSYHLFEDIGHPTSQFFPVRLYQNGRFFGLYNYFEHPEKTYLTRNGLDADTGSTYEADPGDESDCRYHPLAELPDWYEKHRIDDGDFNELHDFLNGINNLTGQARRNFIFDNVDIPRMLNYWAAIILMHDNDCVGKNYYLYRDNAGTKRWYMLPWDKDLTWGRNWQGQVLNDEIWANIDSISGRTNVTPSHPLFGNQTHLKYDYLWNRLIDALLNEPDIRDMYFRRLRTLMDEQLQAPGTPYAERKLERRIDEQAALMDTEAAMDYARWGSWGQIQTNAQAAQILKDSYLAVRRTHLFVTHRVAGEIPEAQTSQPPIVINEIMYNPLGGENDEFLELFNPSSTESVDLSGWRLDGIALTIPPGTILQPQSYLVVAKNDVQFRATYGSGIFVAAQYTGNLENAGENLVLKDRQGNEIDEVSYDDASPWPTAPDGSGPSLELIDVSQNSNRVTNWAPSASIGGTPGASNSMAGTAPFVPDIWLNEVLPSNSSINTDEMGEYAPWIEIYNSSPAAVDLSGMFLTDDFNNLTKWAIPAGTIIGGSQWMILWADAEPNEGPLHMNFALNTAGGSLWFYTASGDFIDSLSYGVLPTNMSYGKYPDGVASYQKFIIPTPAAENYVQLRSVILNEYTGVADNKYLKDNASDTYWGRILGNGGDWFELVVTQDHLDIRGWKLVISDDTGGAGQTIQTLTLTNNNLWSDLRSGTIITVSENLPDNISNYNPAGDKWWINVQAKTGASGTYITASNFNVSQNNWQLTIKDSNSTVVFGPAGEGIMPTSGIGSDEIFKLEDDPSPFVSERANYQDGSSSTFGAPNIYSGGTMVQNFSKLRTIPDTVAPTPNPMTWKTVPTVTESDSITMIATTALDPSGTQYYFDNITDPTHNRGWQSSPYFKDKGLLPNTVYTYRVKARDKSAAQSETAWSTEQSVTTPMAVPVVGIKGSWVTGTTHAKESGTDRALVFIAHAEHNATIALNSVTYGGQAMTKVVENVISSGTTRTYVAAFVLNNAGITAATSTTFTATWSATPYYGAAYESVFLQFVNQAALTGATANNATSSGTTITTSALVTGDGDMVLDAATCASTGTYTVNNGFTRALDLSVSNYDGVAGYKSASGVDETPSVTHTASTRQSLIGFVVKVTPVLATNPNPPNSATNVSLNADLSWTTGISAVSHDVYFGTVSPGEFRNNQVTTTFDLGTLNPSTTYFWRIDERNVEGTTLGTVWSFTTVPPPPEQADYQTPANGAAGVSVTQDLVWTAGAGSTSHDVYFGTTNPPAFRVNQTGTTYDTGTMSGLTTYYWRIDEKNDNGTTVGPVSSFTTVLPPPGQASSPTPANSATGVGITQDLSWTAGSEAASHNVYFGTTNPPPFRVNQTGTTYDTGTMANGTTYYWRIDEKNATSTTTGTAWSFTTVSAIPTYVAAGTVTSSTAAITPALPSGVAANDILLLFLETSNQAISISNQNGGTWTAVTNSPQSTGTAASTTGARLTAFWSRYNGTQGAPTTSDSGDHQMGRMIAIRGAVTSGNPWDVTAGGVEAVSDTSGSIAGATTTVANTLVVAAIATALPDSSITTNFSSWSNSNLSSLTERTDNTTSSNNGGGLGIATGIKATTGAYGNTTVTCASSTYKAMMSIAIKPQTGGTVITPPGQATNPTPANSAANVAVTTDLSWTAGVDATSHDVYFGTTNPPTFRVNQTGTTYDTGTMTNGTTYYWRIDEKNASYTTAGEVWSFTAIAKRTLNSSSTAGGDVTTPGEGGFQYDNGTNANIVATADAHYHFMNWTGSAVTAGKVAGPTSASTTVLMDADYDVVANFGIDRFAITASAGANGSISPSGTFNKDYDSSQLFTAAPATGYEVDKWQLDGVDVQTGGNTYTLNNITAAHTVAVSFKKLTYVISASAGPNGSIVPAGDITKDYASSQLFTATPDTGYEVDKWQVDGIDVQTGGTTYTLSNITAIHTVAVTFKSIITYTITGTAGANGTIDPTSAVVYHGSSQLFTAIPDTGYEVDKWQVDGIDAQTGGTTYTLSNITADHTVSVSFKILTYAVTGTAGANGSIDPTNAVVNYNDSQLFTATPNAGYEVDKWQVDGTDAQTGGITYTLSNITAVHIVSVSFKIITYTVTGTAGANGTVAPISVVVDHGSDRLFTAIADAGYEVDKWTVDDVDVQTGGMTYTLSNITAAHAVAVTFKAIPTYTITGTAGANGSIAPTSAVVYRDGSQLFTAIPDTGYEIDKWTVDDVDIQTGGRTYTLANITADHTVAVTFMAIPTYTITGIAGANGSIDPTSAVVYHGSSQMFTAIPDIGYEVDKWQLDGIDAQTGGTTYTLSNITADHTVSVSFKILTYAVTGTAGANGSIDPTSVVVNYNDSQLFTATPNAGYEVDKWQLDGIDAQTGGTTYTLSNITATHTVAVSFKILTYTVTGNAGANGTIAPISVVVDHGSDRLFTAIADAGYEVDKWTVDDVDVQTGGMTYTLSNITAAHTVAVTFKAIPTYTITGTAGANGSIAPTSVVVYRDGSQLFTATPDIGYEVDKWQVDGIDVQTGGNTYTLSNITSDKTVTVTFVQIEYTLIVNTVGSGAAARSPDQTSYHYGDVVQLQANPATGWSFSSWSGDLTGSENPKNITITGNTTVTATFTQIEYTLTVNTVGSGTVTKTPEQTTYHYNDVVQLQANAATDWSFSSWSGDLSGSTNPTTITINGNKTVTATFTLIPPAQASNPTPANSATNIGITTDLSWTAGARATSHDVYFGTASTPPLVSSSQTGTTYDTGTMANGTTYYWRIDEKNAGGTTTGTVWSFTTIVAAPGQATSPTPANGATSVGITTDLSWTAGARATSHDVYFGTASTPPLVSSSQTGTTYDTGTMANGTTYYWRIDERNAGGTTTGTVWSFTTIVAAPAQATSPTPANSATNIGITTDLSWTAGARATSHDVYFGTASTPPLVSSSQTGTTYDTGTMSYSTTYYWRIDEKNAGGTTTGTVWSFTTIVAAPAQATSPTPANSATNVGITTDLSWTAGARATSHDVYFGTASTPPLVSSSQTGTTYDTGTMANGTTYYWRIDEKNAGGTTTGIVWSFTTIVAAPAQATSPTPASGATNVGTTTDLSWTAGARATSHDVYFGTASTPPLVSSSQTGTTYDTGTMAGGTTYYWRIDERNAGGTTTGTVWSFTTQSSLPAPAAYWRLNETSGTTASDSAGTNTGTLQGTTLPTWAAGKYGNCLTFAAGGGKVNVPSSASIDFADQDLSVSLWAIQPTSFTGQYELFIKGTIGSGAYPGSGKRYELYRKDANFRFAIDDNVTKSEISLATTNFCTGSWVHIVAVRDTVANQIRLYANGVLQGTATDSTGSISQTEPLNLADGVFTNGSIDDVRVYRYALTQAQITAIYNGAGL